MKKKIMLILLFAAFAVNAISQTSLVSNLSVTGGYGGNIGGSALLFTTDDYTHTLYSFKLKYAMGTPAYNTLKLYSSGAGNQPGTLLATLGPGQLTSNNIYEFMAPCSTRIAASTTYWIVMEGWSSMFDMTYTATYTGTGSIPYYSVYYNDGTSYVNWGTVKGIYEVVVDPPASVNPTSGGAITPEQTICSGVTPASLTSSTLPSGNTGLLEYKWQSSTTSSSSGFTDIASSNSSTYSPGTLTQSTWYKRLSKAACLATWPAAGESNVVQITVPIPTTANAGTDQAGTATCGITSVTLAGNTPSVGTGEWSIINGTGGTVSTPSSATSTFTGTAGSTYLLRWTITSNSCISTDDVNITFIARPAAPISVTATPSSMVNGSTSQLKATATSTIDWWTASSGGTLVGSSASGANYAVTPASTTTYYAETSSDVSYGNILGNVVYSNHGSGNWTLGYSFTPSTDLTITAVRRYYGSKISIWTDAGTLLVSQAVSGTDGTWTQVNLATPIILTAGVTYRIGVYNNGGFYGRSDMDTTFAKGVIVNAYQSTGDVMPTGASGGKWWLVDLVYAIPTPCAS
ncbi:MAG: choice-of-anchor R domain-containing protein, partial [Bacteroidales bacterium]